MATITVSPTLDTWLDSFSPTVNRDSLNLRIGDQGGSDGARSLIRFTMPANPGGGVITEIKIELYCHGSGGGTDMVTNMYYGTSTPATSWGETTATWNSYNGSTGWTAVGGFSDFISTIVDSVTIVTADQNTVLTWYLMGGTADNPLTLNWGDTVNLMFRAPSSLGKQYDFRRSEAANPPLVTITYTTNLGFLNYL